MKSWSVVHLAATAAAFLAGCTAPPSAQETGLETDDHASASAGPSGFLREDGVWEAGFVLSSDLKLLLPPADRMDVSGETAWRLLAQDVAAGMRRGSVVCDAIDVRLTWVRPGLASEARRGFVADEVEGLEVGDDGVNAVVLDRTANRGPGARAIVYTSESGEIRGMDVVLRPDSWRISGRKRKLFWGRYVDAEIAHAVALAAGCHDERVLDFMACGEQCPGWVE